MDYIKDYHMDSVECQWCEEPIYICTECYGKSENDRWFCSKECKRADFEEYRELHYEDDTFTLVTPETPKGYIRFMTTVSMNGSVGTVALFMSEEDYFQSLEDDVFGDFFSDVVTEGIKAMNNLKPHIPENGFVKIFYVEYDSRRQRLFYSTDSTVPDPGIISIYKGVQTC